MEAVPKLPMLSFELKISPVCPDFATPFKRLIFKYYGENGDLYDREIMELETLRNNACRVSRDIAGCSLLKRYYSQIYSAYNRFCVFEQKVGVQCVWADIYTGQTNIGDLDFELACILYNIGALHADLGASDSRQTADEMKVCCTHFQCAAWAFQNLMEDGKLYRSNDLSNDVLLFFVQIMLAQAQECILEKSMLDNRKASIVAKVAAQVVEFYQSAISMLQQGAMNTSSQSSIIDVIGSKSFKEWKKFVEFKMIYYNAICSLYMGNFSEEQQKMGERVSWYESADVKLKEAIKLSKQLDAHAEVMEAVNFVADVITVKLSNSKKENDFIYHEKVLPIEQLPEVKGASLVKGIPFNICDPEVSGQDIFARLVPLEAHETASIYSARKDEILRSIRGKIEERNQELVTYLSSLQLEKENLYAPKEDAIPDELVDICAELSLNPNGVEEVDKILTELENISEETDKLIVESKQLLKEEEEKEQKHQEKFGKRPPSLILVDLSKELAKHIETHNKAIQSNKSLWENFEQHRDDVSIMTSSSASKIASILPSNKDIKFDQQTVEQMEKLFDKIDEMKKQRTMLESNLVKEMDADNVLKLVLAHSKSEIESIFNKEIKKYDKIIGLIEQNLSAQDNILRALTNCNASYAGTRKEIIEVQRNRKTRIASLLYTYQVFKELQTNSKKGLEFYNKFNGIVTRLNARIRGVSKVQDEERSQFINAQAKKIASISIPNAVPSLNQPGAVAKAPYLATYNSPQIPATGAKLKDYLPYLNNRSVASNLPIPAASYLSSNTASTVPLSQNYPPQSSTPQSINVTPYPQNSYSVGPVSNMPTQSNVPVQQFSAMYSSGQYAYLSPQPSSSATLNYSPPPSYSQAIASTVSYSLPAVLQNTSSVSTSISAPSPRPPLGQYPIANNQQFKCTPISSVLPIESQQISGYGGSVSYGPSVLPQHSSIVNQAAILGGQANQPSYVSGQLPINSYSYSNNSAPTQQMSSLPTTPSYYYPAPVISQSANSVPSTTNVYNSSGGQSVMVQPQPSMEPTYYQPRKTDTTFPVQQPTAAANLVNPSIYPQYQNSYSSTTSSPYMPQESMTINAVQVTPQLQNNAQQYYGINQNQTIDGSNNQMVYPANPNVMPYSHQPTVPNGQASAPNTVAATIQAIEQESKRGWPVLTPTVIADSEQNGNKCLSQVPSTVNGHSNSSLQMPLNQVETSADALPDILATMSISNQTPTITTKESQVTSLTNLQSKDTNANSDNPKEPKDLLSQFDPLFT